MFYLVKYKKSFGTVSPARLDDTFPMQQFDNTICGNVVHGHISEQEPLPARDVICRPSLRHFLLFFRTVFGRGRPNGEQNKISIHPLTF